MPVACSNQLQNTTIWSVSLLCVCVHVATSKINVLCHQTKKKGIVRQISSHQQEWARES